MKVIFATCFVFALTSCASSRMESDPSCEPIRKATAVLDAVNRYVRETHSPPKLLSELVPKYLTALPSEPQVTYIAADSLLSFSYIGYAEAFDYSCLCKAKLRQSTFKCHCIT